MGYDIDNGSTPVIMFKLVDTDGVTPVTGLAGTMTVTLSKNGANFDAATNSPAEVLDTDDTTGMGIYKITLTATETNTNGPLWLHVEDASALDWDDYYQVVDAQPDVNVYSVEAGVTVDANLVSADATYDGANFVFDATALEQITVYLIRYALANIESSGKDTVGGVTMPTKDGQSLAAAIARLVNNLDVDEINELLTIYETDGVTAWFTQDITTSATAKPLTSGTTN